MGRLERFLGKPVDYVMKAEDGTSDEVVKLNPLSLDELPLFMRALKIKSAITQKEDGTSDIDMSKIEPDAVEALREVVYLTLKRAVPDENDEVLKKFAFYKFFDLLPVILEVNLGKFQKKIEGGVKPSFQ